MLPFFMAARSSANLKIRDAAWFKVEDGPLRTTAMTSARLGDHTVRMRVSIHQSVERIDFEVSVDSAGMEAAISQLRCRLNMKGA